ncbi:MAG: alpha/beta hydrolase [Alphaproteobacteria bacterium]|nr:alpha/beta hydrolase [Alphaproteobacteria bacterium]
MRKSAPALALAVLALILALAACAKPPFAAIAGDWEGAIEIGPTKLPVVFHIAPDGTASLDSPAQGAFGIACTDLALEGTTVRFNVPSVDGAFEGTYDEAAGTIAGTWTQRGVKLPLQLERSRGGIAEAPPRAGEELALDTATGPLHGTLLLPEGTQPFRAAILHAGSGPTDRDGNQLAIGLRSDSLKLLAEGLAAQGIATLRIDKRGIAGSASALKSEADLTVDMLADDLLAWEALLEKRSDIASVALIGHSEGAMIAALAAVRGGADRLVLLSAPGRRFGDIIADQLAAGGAPDELKAASQRIIDALARGEDVADVPKELMALYRPSVQPYMRSLLKYDPQEVVSRVAVPLLIVQGTNDLQIGVADAQRLAEGNPSSEVVIVEGMNHILKAAPPERAANVATYFDADRPLADGLVAKIAEFLNR